MNPLRKCVSLQSENEPGHIHINDYLKTNASGVQVNRQYLNSANVTWLRLWVYWDMVQPNPPANMDQAFTALSAPQSKWTTLDENIRAANDDGMHVILACDRWAPWANTHPNPNLKRWTAPNDVDAESPWGWFISYLMLRYTGVYNPSGPVPSALQGNPYSARVHALEIVNEPNHAPRTAINATMECKVAQMIQTADALARFFNTGGVNTPVILAPATSDSGGPNATNPAPFAEGILEQLQGSGFQTTYPCYWTHHNYKDIKNSETSRFAAVDAVLGSYPWTGRSDRRRIWITEGGCEIDYYLGSASAGTYTPKSSVPPSYEPNQAKFIKDSWDAMTNHPRAYMWTQHAINDSGQPQQYGLFWDWVGPPFEVQGEARTSAVMFRDYMNGSATP